MERATKIFAEKESEGRQSGKGGERIRVKEKDMYDERGERKARPRRGRGVGRLQEVRVGASGQA